MLKITIQDDSGSKLFFADGIQIKNYELGSDGKPSKGTFVILFNKRAQVKSSQFLLTSGDIVLIQEGE